VLEFHVNSLVLTSSVLSFFVESSFQLLKGLTLVVEFGLDVLFLSDESVGFLFSVAEELFFVSLEALFRTLLTLF
jgi:hypothetical protein